MQAQAVGTLGALVAQRSGDQTAVGIGLEPAAPVREKPAGSVGVDTNDATGQVVGTNLALSGLSRRGMHG